MVPIRKIIEWIDAWAPFRYALSWDNCGIQVGNPVSVVERILVALDPGTTVMEEARELGCGCLITHHPLLIRPVSAIRTDSWPGSIISHALLSGINIIAAHTNLDAAREGTNTQLKNLLGLEGTEPIEVEPGFEHDTRYLGIGLHGTLPVPHTLESLARQLSDSLHGADIKIAGDPIKPLRRAAICTGSGASLMGKVIAAGSDVFITGDIKYHDAKLAEESGLAIVDIGHFASEKLILEPFAAYLESRALAEGAHLKLFVSKSEKDPFRVFATKC